MRSFLAVDITSEVRMKIGSFLDHLRSLEKTIKWVHPGNIHITLYFFGEIDEHVRVSVEDLIEASVKEMEPFPVSIQGVSAFPVIEHPSVIWIGIKDGMDSLQRIYTSVCQSIQRNKIAVNRDNRKYTPHITIGRVKRGCSSKLIEELNNNMNLMFGTFNATEVVLYKSTLTGRGPIYNPLKVFPLG